MENKKVFALWLLALHGCNTVVKQGMYSGDFASTSTADDSGIPSVIRDAMACDLNALVTCSVVNALIKQVADSAEKLRKPRVISIDSVTTAAELANNFAAFVAKNVLDPARATAARARAANNATAVKKFEYFITAVDVARSDDDARAKAAAAVCTKAADAADACVKALGFLLISLD